MRKKQRYGGLSPHHVRLIRDYLRAVSVERSMDALNVWFWLVQDADSYALHKAKEAGFTLSTVNALKAGIAVLRRKRLGRLKSTLSPSRSFAALGITARTQEILSPDVGHGAAPPAG
jgi:hypothetical protein